MLNELAQKCHEIARSKGFWDTEQDPARGLMLVVSELSEALEELREGHPLNGSHLEFHSTPNLMHLPEITQADGKTWFFYGTEHQQEVTDQDFINAGFQAKPVGVPSELADVIIRTLDLCAAWDIDIDTAVEQKMAYNAEREHMHGGRKF